MERLKKRRVDRWIVLALTFTVLVLFPCTGPVPAGELFHRFTLENGLRVILQENRNAPVVALQLWVRLGSADEKDEEAGICHFIEHMIFKGSEKRKVRDMAREIESLGGQINAYTSYDQTVYHVTIASRYAEAGLDILAEAIQHSTFDPSELEKEREVILEEIRMGRDDPSRRIFKQTLSALFKHHPYGRPIIGSEQAVRAITQARMIDFFKRWYVPNRMVFVGVGDFEPAEMEKKVRAAFQAFRPSSEPLPKRKEEPEPTEPRSVVSHGSFKETYLQLSVPISTATGEDTPALDALAQILGGGESSRLVQRVKLEKGLVDAISASSFTPRDPGAFIIGATLPAEKVKMAIAGILDEVERIGQEGVVTEELHRVKVNVESDLIYDRQTVQGQARKMGYYETVTGDVHFEKEYLRRMALLEGRDLQRVVRKYFRKTRWVASILAPTEKTDALQTLAFQEILEGQTTDPVRPERRESEAVSKRILENGIRLIVKGNRSIPAISIQASFLGGVRFEEEAQNGINQFLAVMLTKGTRKRSSLQIAKGMERMAGSLSGFSGYNSLGLSLTVLSQHFDEALSLFAEVLREPAFDPDEMEKRRRSILAAIRQQEDDLDRMVFKLFRKTLFEQHPYRMDALGRSEVIERLTPNDLRAYYERVAVPEKMVLTVVGDVEMKQVVQAVQEKFGDMRHVSFPAPLVSQETSLPRTKRAEVYQDKEQAHFVLGFRGPSLLHADRYALEVLEASLSGQGGRLFYELRDQESLAYALAFFAHPNLDPGYLGVYMGTHPDKLERAIEAVLRVLGKVKEGGLTEEEVVNGKRYLIGNFEIGLQTNSAQASQISLDELYGLGFGHYQKYPKEIEKITRDDVHRVARTYLDLDAYTLAIIRPPTVKGR